MTKQGEAMPVALGVVDHGHRFKLQMCEWVPSAGRTCQVPVGTLVTSDKGRMRRERYCAYHRHRAGRSLYGQYTSERAAFLTWLDGVSGRGPFPYIWQADRERLWAVVSGLLSWAEFDSERQAAVVMPGDSTSSAGPSRP